MALSTVHGSFRAGPNLDLDTDTIGNTYTVSGLAFQPKGLIFWWNGLDSAGVDATSETTNQRQGFGFATSTSDRRCVSVYGQDAAGSMVTSNESNVTSCISTLNGQGVQGFICDINAINSDGFQLIVDTAHATIAVTVFWVAIGGSDVTNATTGSLTEPAATGNQSYTVTGSFQPTIAFFSSIGTNASAGEASLMFGAATGTGAGNQFVFSNNQDEGSAASDADRYARGDECLAIMTVAGGNPATRAQFNGFDSVGFDLNWVARAVTGREYIYLAIAAGSNVKVGTMTVDLTTLNNTTTISGLSFQPDLGMIVSHGTAEQTAGTSTTEGMLSVGSFTSTSSRRCQSFRDENGTATAEINLGLSYDEVLQLLTTAGAIDAEADLDAITSDGFRLICDDALGSNVFAGYIALGNPAAAAEPDRFRWPYRFVRKRQTQSQKQRLM